MTTPKLSLKELIVRYVVRFPGVTPPQIARHFKVEHHRARVLVRELTSEGCLRRATPDAVVRSCNGLGLGVYPPLLPIERVRHAPPEG